MSFTLALSFLGACSDYNFNARRPDDSAVTPTNDTAIPAQNAPDYPLSQLLDECLGLNETACAYDVTLRATDPTCTAPAILNRASLDCVANDMADQVDNGGKSATVFARYYLGVSSKLETSGQTYAGSGDYAEMSVSLGDNSEQVRAWSNDVLIFNQFEDFPVTHLYCYAQTSEFDDGSSFTSLGNAYQTPASDTPEYKLHVFSATVEDKDWIDVIPLPDKFQYQNDDTYDIGPAQYTIDLANDKMMTTTRYFLGIDENSPSGEYVGVFSY